MGKKEELIDFDLTIEDILGSLPQEELHKTDQENDEIAFDLFISTFFKEATANESMSFKITPRSFKSFEDIISGMEEEGDASLSHDKEFAILSPTKKLIDYLNDDDCCCECEKCKIDNKNLN